MGELTRAIALSLVDAAAPEELSVLDDVLEAMESPRDQREDPLASGIGESWVWAHMASPALIAVAAWLAKDIVGKAASELIVPRLKSLAERLIKPSSGARVRVLDADDHRAIAAVLDVLQENAKRRGLDPKAADAASQALEDKLKSILASTPIS